MKKASLTILTLLTLTVPAVLADTTWISTSSSTFSTAANWNNGLPSTGPQLGIFADSATIQHLVDVTGTARVSIGLRFDLFSGGAGFVFNSSSSPGPGFIIRAGGSVGGILNNDENTQTFNVPMKLTDAAGLPGNTGSKQEQIWNAAAGDLIFQGTNQTSAAWSVNLNGATNLTITGSFNTRIGSADTAGAIVNTNAGTISGLTKDGAGTLTLAGTAANTYNGTTILKQGSIIAAKAEAFGTGGMTLLGGTLKTGGFSHTLGTLDLEGSAVLDLAGGSGTLSFANSSAVAWNASAVLDIQNWTTSTQLRFGADGTGLTQSQLGQLQINGVLGQAGLDPSGFIVVPEPSSFALAALGGVALAGGVILRRRRN